MVKIQDHDKSKKIITDPYLIGTMVSDRWCVMPQYSTKIFQYKAYPRQDLEAVTGIRYMSLRSLIHRGYIPPPLFMCAIEKKPGTGNKCWVPCHLYEETVAIAQKAELVYSRYQYWKANTPETKILRAEIDIIRSDLIRRLILNDSDKNSNER